MHKDNTNILLSYTLIQVNNHVPICFPVPPIIEKSDEVVKPEVVEGNPLTLTCNASGIPPPDITWSKNGVTIPANTSNYNIVDGGIKFQILNAHIADSTRFTCKVENVAGFQEKNFDVNVLGKNFYLKCAFRGNLLLCRNNFKNLTFVSVT